MYYQDNAIILFRRDYREDDLLIHAYTQNHGKIILVSRGAKKIKSKLSGHIQPISLSELTWVGGRAKNQLIGAYLKNSYRILKEDLNKISYAAHFLNMVDELTQESVKDKRIFELLRSALDFLEKKSNNYSLARITFGYKLLYLLGLNPALKQEKKHKDDIDFVVKSSINQIITNKKIDQNLFNLNKILSGELEGQLNRQIIIEHGFNG